MSGHTPILGAAWAPNAAAAEREEVTVRTGPAAEAFPIDGTAARLPAERAFVPGELLVRFESGTAPPDRSAALDEVGATLEEKLLLPHLQLVDLDPGTSVSEAAAEFEALPEVRYAEPNFIRHLDAMPNDPSFPQLWGLHNTGQTVNGTAGAADADIDAPEAWDHTVGSSAVQVAIVDSGVSYGHPDLAIRWWMILRR